MKCSNCGNELSNNTMFCDNCGQKVELQANNAQKCYCGNCGAEVEAWMEFCGNCGTRINKAEGTKPTRVFCGNCGAEIDIDAEFCGNCGASVGSAAETATINAAPVNSDAVNFEKKKSNLPIVIVALALAGVLVLGAFIFVGYKFYVSKIIKNITESQDISISEQVNGSSDTNSDRSTGKQQPTAQPTIKPTAEPQKEMPAPVFTYVTASSTRGTDTEGGQYSAEAVLNYDQMTKWVPSKDSKNGVSEWIQINATEAQYVKGIAILNGYHKSAETWSNNNRVKNCTLTFSNGQSKNVTLDDTMDLIKIDLDTPVSTTYVRLTINSVYSGAKWDDTAITYLAAY